MSKTTIPTGGITADAIDSTLIADDAVSEEHLDATALTGNAALAEAPSDTDEFLFSDGGTLKRIDYSYIKGEGNTPGWLATMTGAQSISNATYTTVQFNTESDGYDTDSGFDTSTYTFTVPSGEGGKYFITAGVYVAANSNHEYVIKLVTSAGDRGEAFIAGINRDVGITPQTTVVQSLNAGQSVYVQIYQNTGGSKNTSYGVKNCWFGGFKISS